jgi:hypothetical protein
MEGLAHHPRCTMPGSVSDAYDPEFGTATHADAVRSAIAEVCGTVSRAIGTDRRRDVLEVAGGEPGRYQPVWLSERDLRVIRFALDRALESV